MYVSRHLLWKGGRDEGANYLVVDLRFETSGCGFWHREAGPPVDRRNRYHGEDKSDTSGPFCSEGIFCCYA